MVGACYLSRSKQLDFQECVNLYPEMQGPGSKSVAALIGCPGKKRFATIDAAGTMRGMHTTASGRLFVVMGSSLIEVYSSGAYDIIGSLLTVTGIVGMADNGNFGNQLCICDGVAGYIYSLKDSTFQKIPDFCPNGTHVIFKDQFFLMNSTLDVDRGKFFAGALLDGLTWDAATFGTAEGSPDNIVAIGKTNNEIWLFGEQSAEVWYNAGNVDFPFLRISNAFSDVGTSAPYSVAQQGNDIFWLGSNNRGHGVVWMATGYQPQRISTHAIEYMIASMPRSDDAIGYCYQQEGHFFYVLNFPTANRTLAFDQSTGLWHERQTYNEATNRGNRDRGLLHAYAFGKHIVGDFTNGNLYELDLNTYTDDGAKMQAIRSLPHAHDNMERVYYYEFEADMEKGVGTIHETQIGPFGTIVNDDFQSYTLGAFTSASGDEWDLVSGYKGENLQIANI